jgi:hypothetical protein
VGSATHQVDPPGSGEDVLWLAPKVLAEAFRNLRERKVSASHHITMPAQTAMSKRTNRGLAAENWCILCQIDPGNSFTRMRLPIMHVYPYKSIASPAWCGDTLSEQSPLCRPCGK